jgi:hypothetical protein
LVASHISRNANDMLRIYFLPCPKTYFSFVNKVVNGSPLTNRPLHEPVSSFDANGRYIGLPNLVQMLQNTPDTPEPESPYEIHEPVINLPPEQRSPVVQQPTDDPRVIFNKVKL